MRNSIRVALLGIVPLLLALSACSSTYYRALETVGIEKRDILADRVEDAREAQGKAKDQFTSALEEYRAVVAVDGGDLEDIYDRLNAEYERSVDRADAVRERIDAVERVADDLFEEWQEEIDAYTDPELARRSRALLSGTQADYRDLLAAMHQAEQKMDPVLAMFNDQVMFLRHNLNARAIAALQDELLVLEEATETLVRDMERAIAEATSFIEKTQ